MPSNGDDFKFKFQTEEPAANTREMARSFRDMFVALVHEGFTEAQALALLSNIVRGAMENNRRDGT